MKRIDVTKLAPITRDILRSWTAPSWRADSFDPEFDGDTAPPRRPNLIVHRAFYDVVDTAYAHGDLDNWA